MAVGVTVCEGVIVGVIVGVRVGVTVLVGVGVGVNGTTQLAMNDHNDSTSVVLTTILIVSDEPSTINAAVFPTFGVDVNPVK